MISLDEQLLIFICLFIYFLLYISRSIYVSIFSLYKIQGRQIGARKDRREPTEDQIGP